MSAPHQPWKRYLGLGLAVLTCPCHLPLLLVALTGTALGGWLSQHTIVVSLSMVGIFLLALFYGLGALGRRQKSVSGARTCRKVRPAMNPPSQERTYAVVHEHEEGEQT